MVLGGRADGDRGPPRGPDGRGPLGDLLPGRIARRPLRVHDRDHAPTAPHPHPVARRSPAGALLADRAAGFRRVGTPAFGWRPSVVFGSGGTRRRRRGGARRRSSWYAAAGLSCLNVNGPAMKASSEVDLSGRKFDSPHPRTGGST